LLHDDLFPIELLGSQAQESILREFGGRRPTVVEIASIPEANLLKLPGFGPSTVRKVRSIALSGTASSSALAGLNDDEVLLEHDRLSAELSELREEFKKREHELKRRLGATRLELRVRGHARK
jgi:hypothetical protein